MDNKYYEPVDVTIRFDCLNDAYNAATILNRLAYLLDGYEQIVWKDDIVDDLENMAIKIENAAEEVEES